MLLQFKIFNKKTMKRILICVSLIVTFIACKSSKEINKNKMLFEGCPEGGECTFEMIENTRVFMAGDEQMGYFPKLENSKSTHTVKISYIKETEEGIMDDEYREVFYFSIGQEESQMRLTNENLEKASLIYGRICACRGQTGYEKINQGTLKVNLTKHYNKVDFKIKTKKFPILMSEAKIEKPN